MKKLYRVSIECQIPANYEWEGDAKNEKEAFKFAMNEAENIIEDGVDENSVDFCGAIIGGAIKNEKSTGVWIEEIKNSELDNEK